MGLNNVPPPKHSKRYGNLGNEIQEILQKYKIDVERKETVNSGRSMERSLYVSIDSSQNFISKD